MQTFIKINKNYYYIANFLIKWKKFAVGMEKCSFFGGGKWPFASSVNASILATINWLYASCYEWHARLIDGCRPCGRIVALLRARYMGHAYHRLRATTGACLWLRKVSHFVRCRFATVCRTSCDVASRRCVALCEISYALFRTSCDVAQRRCIALAGKVQ